MVRSLRWITVTGTVALTLLLGVGTALADDAAVTETAGDGAQSTDGTVLAPDDATDIGTAAVVERSTREKTGPLLAPSNATQPYTPDADAATSNAAAADGTTATSNAVPSAPTHTDPSAATAAAPSNVHAPAAAAPDVSVTTAQAARARAAVRDRLPEGTLQPAAPAPILGGIGAETGGFSSLGAATADTAPAAADGLASAPAAAATTLGEGLLLVATSFLGIAVLLGIAVGVARGGAARRWSTA